MVCTQYAAAKLASQGNLLFRCYSVILGDWVIRQTGKTREAVDWIAASRKGYLRSRIVVEGAWEIIPTKLAPAVAARRIAPRGCSTDSPSKPLT